MLPVKLILSGSQQQRVKLAFKISQKALRVNLNLKNAHPDLIVLKAPNSLGIGQIRNLQKQLALKPHSAPVKVALIDQAEKLTLPAQNALLKTLEEPPAKTLIILLAPRKEALLPTIISRCQIIQLIQEPQVKIDHQLVSEYFNIFISILNSGIGERLKIAQNFSQREKALKLTHHFLWLWRETMLSKTGVKKEKGQEKLKFLTLLQIKTSLDHTENIRTMIEANVNPRLAMENLLLSYPKKIVSKQAKISTKAKKPRNF